jgi:glycosyltransferase involved in cell wall biosynthesis
MNILWLSHRDPLNPRAGGAERTISEVCLRLAKKGHIITLVTGGWKNCLPVEYFNGIEIHRFGRNVGPHLSLPVFIFKNKYDIVVNDLGHAVPWFSPVLLVRHNIAFFRHLHARSLPGQVRPVIANAIKALEKCYFILYHDTVFVTESKTSKNDLLNLGIKENEIVLNPPGVDMNLFHPSAKTSYPSMVYFGGMRRYKRPQEIIYLLKSLLAMFHDIKLYIVGAGPEEENLKNLTSAFNLQNHVIFKGRITNEELSDIVSKSWLNIHTSVTEGWGYSILEASASGTPTVAYDVPGVRDAVEDGNNGLKVKDGDRKALLEAAYSILSDPERWWLSSLEVAKKYSWDKTAEVWEDLIKKLEANKT